MLADGQIMPVDVSNGTVLTGQQPQKLMNAIETAGDLTLIQRVIPIVGTEFGIKRDPMPKSINITTKDYNCSIPTMKGSKSLEKTTTFYSDRLVCMNVRLNTSLPKSCEEAWRFLSFKYFSAESDINADSI